MTAATDRFIRSGCAMRAFVTVLVTVLSLTISGNAIAENIDNFKLVGKSIAGVERSPFICSDYYKTIAVDSVGGITVIGGEGYEAPTRIMNSSDIVDITSKFYVTQDGRVYEYYISAGIIRQIDIEGVVDIEEVGDGWIALKNDGTVWSKGVVVEYRPPTQQERRIIQVPNLHDIVDIDGSIALRSDGTVWIWGMNLDYNNNYNGILGVDVYDKCIFVGSEPIYDCSRTPRQVIGLSNIVAITSSRKQFNAYMALDRNGHVWVWGQCRAGGFGDGTHGAATNTPRMIPNLEGVIAIAMGSGGDYSSYWLALKNDGTVWTWGAYIDGSDNTNYRNTPVRIEGLNSIASIHAGVGPNFERVFAIDSDGWVWALGKNVNDLLGDVSDLDREMPVAVMGVNDEGFLNLRGDMRQPDLVALEISGQDSIDAGAVSSYSATAIYSDGRRKSVIPSWSVNTDKVQVDPGGRVSTGFSSVDQTAILSASYSDRTFSIGTTKQITINAKVPAIVSPQIKSGMVLMPDGTVKSWGGNEYGQLGDGTKRMRSAAVQVNDLTDVVYIDNTGQGSQAVKNDGTVWMWGHNTQYSRDANTNINEDSLIPMRVQGLSGVAFIKATDRKAVKTDGTLWDYNYIENIHQIYDAPDNIISIEPPLYLTANGNVLLYGFNNSQYEIFTRVESLHDIVEIAVIDGQENKSYYALDNEGHIWAWGDNTFGQLGDGTMQSRNQPATIATLENIDSITGGGHGFVYAVDRSGSVWTWGLDYNRLNSGFNKILSPVRIPTLTNVKRIASDGMVLKYDGTLWTWGDGYQGRLGNGTISSFQLEPTLVISASLTEYLDLLPDVPDVIPPDRIPPFLSITGIEGELGFQTVTVEVNMHEFTVNDVAISSSVHSTRSNPVYNVYVGAIVPGEILSVSQPSLFMLNSTNSWGQYLGGSLPEYIRNVEVSTQDHRLMLRILTDTDVRQLIGTTFYVGYGTSDLEMLQSGRVRAVYTVSNASTAN